MKKRSRTNWEHIDALKDEQIDYSDNPKLDKDFFARAVPWPMNKELISLRLDRDVLTFFRKQGRGYQTVINALLRRYMEEQSPPSSGKPRSRTTHRKQR